MISISLDDEHLTENVKAVRELQNYPCMTDGEIQRLYDKQIEKDKAEQERG